VTKTMLKRHYLRRTIAKSLCSWNSVSGVWYDSCYPKLGCQIIISKTPAELSLKPLSMGPALNPYNSQFSTETGSNFSIW